MCYIAAEDVAKAKEMDLLTYLRNYEPQELVHVSGNNYCTREHDSLRISNGKWCWFSQGIGGRSALDYLIKVKGIPFTQAAEIILGREAPVFYRQKERRHTELLTPELSETTEQVEKYLYGRGIHPVIICYCLDNRLLFESADFHSALFVGYDKDGKARYGALRSTVSIYKGELTGSDKHFSFFLEGKPNAEYIHVFESAIDLLSFATLALLAGRDWKSETYGGRDFLHAFQRGVFLAAFQLPYISGMAACKLFLTESLLRPIVPNTLANDFCNITHFHRLRVLLIAIYFRSPLASAIKLSSCSLLSPLAMA